MDAIMGGEATPAQIAAVLVALRTKGETADEITGFAEAMREHVVPVTPTRARVIDVVGTGGDGARVQHLHGRGARRRSRRAGVAKHGNRRRSSACGSADVLRGARRRARAAARPDRAIDRRARLRLHVRARAPPRHAPCRAHAPGARRRAPSSTCSVHSPTRRARATASSACTARRSPGPTPRRSPSSARGVHSSCTGTLRHRRALPRRAEPRRGGRRRAISEWTLDPRELGLAAADPGELAGGSAQENAAAIRAVLDGERSGRRAAVVLNAGLALVAAGIADDLRDGLARAAAAIDTRGASSRLDAIVSFSQETP